MKLKFSGRGLAFLSHFKADNDIRYYLTGVCFQPLPAEAGGGVIGAATNGHIMGVWHDSDGHCDRKVIARISRPMATACKKPGTELEAIDGRLAALRYEEIQGQPKLVEEMCVQPNGTRTARGGVQNWEIEGSFPDLMRVIHDRQDYKEGPTGTFNAEYLSLFTAALRAASTRHQRLFAVAVQMRQRDRDSSMLITSHSMPEALVVVMPMHGDDCGAPWLEKWRRHGLGQQAIAAAGLPSRQPSDAAPPPCFIPQVIGKAAPAGGRA